MERVNKILIHPVYLHALEQIEVLEKERIFCGHGLQHLMDVARISYLLALERKSELHKELIYSAALLHDCGRGEEYLRGTPHEIASAKIAEDILGDCNFTGDETEMITDAIQNHRVDSIELSELSIILYGADKMSRNCFSCKVKQDCNWTDSKKNLQLLY